MPVTMSNATDAVNNWTYPLVCGFFKKEINKTIPTVRCGKGRQPFHPLQAVGPEHFGIVAVDCAKARSKWMLCDFYGRVLIQPTIVEHQRASLTLATVQLRDACERHGLQDHIVAVEMTGTYHRPVQRAFRQAGSETRLVHPFASRHYRQPSHADTKTDDNDLEGIFRAAVNGFGLLEPTWGENYLQLQVLARHRRDLVQKRAKLQIQIRQFVERCLPGYGDLFPDDNFWKQSLPLTVARRAGCAEGIRAAGVRGVTQWLKDDKTRYQSRSVERVVTWAPTPPTPTLSPLNWRVSGTRCTTTGSAAAAAAKGPNGSAPSC
jgi:hypothetical protein